MMSSHRVTAEEMKDHQVTDYEDQNSGEEHQIIRSTRKVPVQHEWILLAIAIDRVSFLVYGFLFAILALVYSI